MSYRGVLSTLVASGLGVALLAGLTSHVGARAPGEARKREARKRRRRPSRREGARRTGPRSRKRSSKPGELPEPPAPRGAPPAPPKPPPAPRKSKRKRKAAKEPDPLKSEYTVTATKGEPMGRHTVRVRPPDPPAPKVKRTEPAPLAELSPRQAAQRMYDYAAVMISDGRASELGTKGAPNRTIRRYQEALGKLTPDGIYGPKTRARGKELLGRSFPVRKALKPPVKAAPPPEPPAPRRVPEEEPPELEAPALEEGPKLRSPKEAAQDLFSYAKKAPKVKGRGAYFGLRHKPSETVRLAQADMGELTPDGIYGPATRKRGRALLGRVFPAR